MSINSDELTPLTTLETTLTRRSPSPETPLLCLSCGHAWDNDDSGRLKGWFCPTTLNACLHRFCTRCSIYQLESRCLVPSCATAVPAFKQQVLKTQLRAFALRRAVHDLLNDGGRYSVPIPMTSDPEFRVAIKKAASYLNDRESVGVSGNSALVDTPIIAIHLAAMANLLPAFLEAKERSFDAQQRRQWPHIVMALYKFLEFEATKRQPEIHASSLLNVLESNVKKTLKIDPAEVEFFVENTRAHDIMQALFGYIVQICKEAYAESRRSKRERTTWPLHLKQ